jgi:nitrite reductase/ring-hydroxylating ferredoxin subunit
VTSGDRGRVDRVALGPVAEIPTDRCLATADGRVVVVRVGDQVCAYRNRCLHQDSPLDGGWVRRGVLSCPLHFWRYDVATGQHRDGGGRLERFEVEVVDGEAYVLLPPEPRPTSLREELLARAADYDRADAYRRERGEGG